LLTRGARRSGAPLISGHRAESVGAFYLGKKDKTVNKGIRQPEEANGGSLGLQFRIAKAGHSRVDTEVRSERWPATGVAAAPVPRKKKKIG